MNHSARFVLPFLFVASLAAQGTLSVNPSPIAQAGQQVTINYSNPGLAGQTIVVVVSGGVPRVEKLVSIKLDAAGNGSGTWVAASDWDFAEFTAPQSASVRVSIE